MAWWTVAGQTCVAAYQPIGAASLAASYSNLAAPGVNDAYAGSAPAFDAALGWVFNGTSNHLLTGLVPVNEWSAIVRFAGGSGSAWGEVLGGTGTGDYRLRLAPIGPGDGTKRYYGYGGQNLWAGDRVYEGVMAVTRAAAYLNGAPDGTITSDLTGTNAGLVLGAFASGSGWWNGSIAAVAVYSDALSAAEVAALTAAMNELPAAGGLLRVQQEWHRAVWEGGIPVG